MLATNTQDLWQTSGFPNPCSGNFRPTFKGTSGLQLFPLPAVTDISYFVKDIKLISSDSVISADRAPVCDTEPSKSSIPPRTRLLDAQTGRRG